MVRLIILTGSEAGREIRLQPGTTVVGRGGDCDLILADASVSSHHCEIRASDLGVQVRDLGSTNGTRLAGQVIERAEVLDGQVVTFGEVEARFEIPRVEISIPPLAPTDEPTQPFLGTGGLACFNHPSEPATYQCPQCQRAFCAGCVRDVRLAGGASHWLCPHCSAPCVRLTPLAPQPTGILAALNRKGGVFDTIRIAFSRGPRRKR
jgi:hypothetical protein